MLPRFIVALLLILVISTTATAGVPEAIAAMNRGDYAVAFKEFSELADKGDDRAMITIGLWFHQGEGFEQDYAKAMEWYIRAFEMNNGDAYNNIGVMYRDGLGVPVNRSVSYTLFLLTHIRGLGSESTQYRANRNLRREVQETTEAQRALGLCMTEIYLYEFIKSRGTLRAPQPSQLPSSKYPRIKDNVDLWLDSEKTELNFECPPPWN